MTAAVTAATAPATATVFAFRAMIPIISPALFPGQIWPGFRAAALSAARQCER
jgi:hypothetical protein